MTSFSRHWLQLREAADHRARCGFGHELETLLSDRWCIVDLGCGTGSNRRFLAAKIKGEQQWICVDHDAELLTSLVNLASAEEGGTFETVQADLASDIAALFDGLATDTPTLLTGSALLDLVSATWIDALVSLCTSRQMPALFALTYDGRLALDPARTQDGELATLINAHQLNDKGFGPALGPDAATYTREAFRQQGFSVTEVVSDWRLDAGDRELQRQLLAGWLSAARDHTADPHLLGDWYDERLAQIDAGELAVRVGHKDLLAIPADRAGGR